MNRGRLTASGIGLVAACVGTLWNADTTFNVTATTETVRIHADSGVVTRLYAEDATLFRGLSGSGEILRGGVEVQPGAELAFERVAKGPVRILVNAAEPGRPAAVVLDQEGKPVGPPVERVVIRIDNPDARAAGGKSLVVPFTGGVELGREVGANPRGHAMLRSADVTFLGHTVIGSRLYDAGRARLDPGDRLVIDGRAPAFGFVTVDERPAMTVVYRVRGKNGRVFRAGAQGYELAAPLRAKLLNDSVIQGLWATFGAILVLYGKFASRKPRSAPGAGTTLTVLLTTALAGFVPVAKAQVLLVGSERGQGITRLRGTSECMVVTAQHVADSFAQTRVVGPPGKEASADVVKSFAGSDLSVLRLGDASFPCDDWKIPASLDQVLQRVDRAAIRIRAEQGGIEQVHIVITGSDERWLRVQPSLANQTIRQTFSGSPVYAEGVLLGVLLSVREGTGNVLRIDRVSELIDPWFGDVQPGMDTPCGSAVRLDEAGWAALRVSGITYLPPLEDSGEPDFDLILTNERDERLARLRINVGRETATMPFPSATLLRSRAVAVSLVEADVFNDEQVVEEIEIPGSRLMACQPIALKIKSTIFRTYPSLDRGRGEIRLTLSPISVDPERKSGPDREPGSPVAVAPGRSRTDTINFDLGDATDHVQVGTVGAVTTALVWITDRHGVELMPVPSGGGRVTRIAESDSGFEKAELDVVERRDGNPLLFRVRAPEPGTRGVYHVYALGDSASQRGALQFLVRFLRDEAPTWGGFGARENELGPFLGALRRHFGISPDAMADVLESDLQARGVASEPDTAGFTTTTRREEARQRAIKNAFAILDAELGEYVRAGGRSREIVGQLLAVLQAERDGRVDDRTSLTAAARARNTGIAVRAIQSIGRLGDPLYAGSVLNSLLLDDRASVSEAARDVLRGMRRP